MQKHYKHHLSGYPEWEQLEHAEEWILFEENIGSHQRAEAATPNRPLLPHRFRH